VSKIIDEVQAREAHEHYQIDELIAENNRLTIRIAQLEAALCEIVRAYKPGYAAWGFLLLAEHALASTAETKGDGT